MHLADLLDVGEFQTMVDLGYIKAQDHPETPLRIFNYTPKAQYERVWNRATKSARGLIVHRDTLEVKARPFEKFFNLGELADHEIPQEPFEVFDKMDGSLGILYKCHPDSQYCGHFALATRGSFTSDQARRGTSTLLTKYGWQWEPLDRLTYLFEIIYPENRIVVDYGGMDDLVLLDVIDNASGASALDEHARFWPGQVVKSYPDFKVLDELLAAPQRDNEEGYVIKFASGMRAKLKHEEYVRLHRIVTGVSTKTIWEHLSQRQSLAALLDNVPDEFYEWVKETTTELQRQYDALVREVEAEYRRVVSETPAFASRKQFAEVACRSPHRAVLFRMLDDKPYEELIWKELKPAFERPFSSQSEDVA